MSLRRRFKSFRQMRYQSWIERRIPASHSIVLNRNNLFILPSHFGFLWLILVILLLLLGNNYQNNLVSLMGLILLSIWLLCLVLCHQNMSGLELRLKQHPEAQQGLMASLKIAIEADKQILPIGLNLNLPKDWGQTNSLHNDDELSLSFTAGQRGEYLLPRVRVWSVFPLGLFRCWSHLNFKAKALFYPMSRPSRVCPADEAQGQGEQSLASGPLMDEFSGLHAYRPGDRLSHVAWKQFAAGHAMQRKDFSSRSGQGLILSHRHLSHLAYEARLEVLCYWAQRLNQEHKPFGLELSHQHLPAGHGSVQLNLALQALAREPRR
ncbi:DUF58 domain-containing protein [Alginatibacterium sediminis]|uniref:DUF58 domain-containing protein n=1 Tax=Alginatibacterium sediminis TaxID=2164068 RepID=A0A420E639_9ALTE|nr:DUF58 domain-containing protein [Alginatibacterium sediminis]RKF13176.1 DUF58 domain-containing protein [Alginatibacterium sediminis]